MDHGGIELSSYDFKGDGKQAPTNWKKASQISSGGFSKVYEASVELNNVKCEMVAKQIRIPEKERKKYEHSIRTEIEASKKLKHRRIVSFYGFSAMKFACFIFMEYVKCRETLSYYFILDNGSLCLYLVKHFTRQLLEGVEYLHSQRIIHRDIKPANILLEDERNIKLTDFGISKIFGDVSKAYTADVGTPRYMAPEMFHTLGYKYPVDIWSSGCVVLEMTTGESPFPKKTKEQTLAIVLSENPSPIPENLPEDVKKFLLKIFKKDPLERPTARDLLMDSFLTRLEIKAAEYMINDYSLNTPPHFSFIEENDYSSSLLFGSLSYESESDDGKFSLELSVLNSSFDEYDEFMINGYSLDTHLNLSFIKENDYSRSLLFVTYRNGAGSNVGEGKRRIHDNGYNFGTPGFLPIVRSISFNSEDGIFNSSPVSFESVSFESNECEDYDLTLELTVLNSSFMIMKDEVQQKRMPHHL